MLNRQRTILSLIQEAGGEATHLSVTKWAFLLREEYPSRGGSSFYQFLPYKYGPFSFCLYQEAAALVRDGLLEERDRTRWSITPAGATAADGVQPKVQADVRRVMRTHAKKSSTALVDYVYERHPAYTINSEIRKLRPRPEASPAVYTAGYEGLLIDGFLNGLIQEGISRLIDVRNNPVSRRYGFHKTTLGRLCRNVGIEYVHFPELGITSRARQDLDRPGARQALFEEYSKTTLRDQDESIDRVADLVGSHPSVLVCMEACARDCHRSRLAEPVAAKTGLPVCHLELAS
jgi:uncharacterized protein (DUF488 family)